MPAPSFEVMEITDQAHRSREHLEAIQYQLDPEYYRRVRPVRDLVFVRLLADRTYEVANGFAARFFNIGTNRIPGFFVAEVLATGPDASPELAPGQEVIVEQMSSPDGMANMVDEQGATLCFVPCKALGGAGTLEEEMERVALRMQGLEDVIRKNKNYTDGPKRELHDDALGRIRRLHAKFVEMERVRATRGRSRRGSIVKDPGQPQGILAIVRNAPEEE